MGLCKCPKRRVTNQFCFEHRVNVCEHCMVSNHSKCIVQSYLQWLQDSDYNPICELCTKELETEDCIRLTCYHVFHWACLDNYSRQLPSTTAPAGYTCPSCKTGLFPPGNLVSPVADVLREKLAGVNWARAGLSLPLLSEDREIKPILSHTNHTSYALPSSQQQNNVPPYSVINVSEDERAEIGAFSRQEKSDISGAGSSTFQASSRRVGFQDARDIRMAGAGFDRDDDKYKRRPPTEALKRWWKNIIGAQSSHRHARGSIYRRYLMLGIILILSIIAILILMSKLGGYYTGDPNFDSIYDNPQIRVQGLENHAPVLH